MQGNALGIFRSKAPSRGLWMHELVLYGIRLLTKQIFGSILDIEVDQSGLEVFMLVVSVLVCDEHI